MATTALVPTEVDQKAAEVEAQVAAAKAQAEAIEVVDQASADNAAELLREIARRRKAAEAERKALKEPILEAGRRVRLRSFSRRRWGAAPASSPAMRVAAPAVRHGERGHRPPSPPPRSRGELHTGRLLTNGGILNG